MPIRLSDIPDIEPVETQPIRLSDIPDVQEPIRLSDIPEQSIAEPEFSMFKETMRNLPSAMWETAKTPIKTLVEGIKIQNEAIEAGKMGAIKTTYDTISGLVEYSRKHFKPIRERFENIEVDGVAIKDMSVITPEIDEFLSGLSQKAKQKFLQSDYVKEKQRIMKKHPIATKVGEVGSDIGLLMAISYATQGKGTSPLLLRLGTRYPKIALTLQSMARSGKVLGIHGFVRELAKTKDLPKAVKAGVGSGSFGALVFGIGGGIENPIVRGLLQTASAHTLDKISSLRAKHQRGEKITVKDFLMPSLQTIFIAALCAITAPMQQRAIKAQKYGYAEKGMGEIQKKGYEIPSGIFMKKGTPLSKMYQFWAKAKGMPPASNIQPKYAQDFNTWANQQAKYPEVSKALTTVKPEQSYQVTPVDKNIVTMTGKGIADEVSRGTVFETIKPTITPTEAPVVNYILNAENKFKKKGFTVTDKDSSYLAMNDGTNGIVYNYANGTHKFVVERQGERAKLFSTSDDYKVDSKISQIEKYLTPTKPTPSPLVEEAKKYESVEKGQYAENAADLLYHGTGEKSSQDILKSGFKTGEELGKGEKTGLISIGTKERATHYSRGEKAGVQLPIPIKGLNLLEVKAGEIYPKNLTKYTKQMNDEGYDGIRIIDDVYTGSGKTAEILLKKDIATKQLAIYNKAITTPTKTPAEVTIPAQALKQAKEHTMPAKSLKIGDMFLHPSGEVYKVIPTPKDAPSNRIYIQDGKKRVLAKSDDIHLKGAVNDPLLVGKAGMKIHGEEWTEGFANIEKPAKLRRRVLKVTGVKKVEIPVATTEMTLLKARLKAEARGAKAGKRVGRIETKKKIYTQLKVKAVEVKELQKSIIDYANENLTKLDRDKIAIIASRAITKHRLARAVTMIDKMEEKYQRHVAVDSLKDTIKEIDFKRLRPEYKAPITAISESIDLVNRKEKTVKGLVNMYKYIQREPENNIPEKQLNRLATLTRTPIKEMTTDDITLIDIALKSLVKQHELKGKLIIKGKVRDFAESRNKAVGNVRNKELADIDPREGIKTSRAKRFFTVDAMNAEHVCKQIDKEEHGVIKEVLYDNLDNGVSEVLKYKHEANDYFWKDVGDILKSPDYLRWDEASWTKNKWAKNVDYQTYKLDSGKTLKITKEERICIELDSRNENNLRRMLEGGYRLRSNPTILYKMTTNDLAKIKQSLTPKEKRVADARYKYFNTIQKDKLNKKSVELNGWEVATENDYFPMADRIYGVDIHKDYLLRNEALPSNMRQFTQSTLESMGALKERISNINPLILESAATITYKSIKQTATYYGLADPLRNAKTLLFDPAFKTSITTRYGSHYWQSLANYIRDMEGEYQRTDNVDKMILDWINKLDVAVLGANPFVMAKQPISLMAAAVEMDSKYVAKALKGKPESKEVISKYSPQLRDRLEGNVTRELGEIAQTGQVRQFWTRKHTLSQSLMTGIKRFDYEAVGRIWKAVEYETNELHPNLTGEAKMKHIAQRTEEVVRLTQPTFHIKDRSAIGRSKSVWARLVTKYSSQRNKNYMMIMRTIDKYNNSNKGTKAKRDFMKGIAIVSVLMPLMLYGVDELRNWLYKRKPSKRKVRYNILKFMEYNLGNVYFVANAFRMFTSGVERGEWFGYGISDVVTSTGEQGVKAMINAYNAIDQTLSQERYKSGDKAGELKWKKSAIRAVNQALSFGTRIKGIPYDTIKKLIIIPFRKPEKKSWR